MKYDKNLIEKRNVLTKNISNVLKVSIFSLVVIIIYNMFLVLLSASAGKETTNVFGYSAYIISSDSMKPTLNAGDVIIIKKVNAKNLKKDDIITFKNDSQIVTHRIVSENDCEFITKGDNNNIEDLFVLKSSEILGIKIFKIPLLGKAIKFISNTFYIFIIIIMLITIYLYNRRKNHKRLIRRKKKRFEDEKNK